VPQYIKARALENDVRDAVDTGIQVNHGAHAKTLGYVEEVIADAPEDCDEEAAAQARWC